MRKKTSAPRECTAPNLMDFEWSSMLFFFFSLSKPSQSMRMVLAIRLFEFRSQKDICSMYAKLLRCTVYACEAALTMGKPQESGETPRIALMHVTSWSESYPLRNCLMGVRGFRQVFVQSFHLSVLLSNDLLCSPWKGKARKCASSPHRRRHPWGVSSRERPRR